MSGSASPGAAAAPPFTNISSWQQVVERSLHLHSFQGPRAAQLGFYCAKLWVFGGFQLSSQQFHRAELSKLQSRQPRRNRGGWSD